MSVFNRKELPLDRSLYSLFRENVKRFSDLSAIHFCNKKALNYRELSHLVDLLAIKLQEIGFKSGMQVPILAEQSMFAVVAILASLKLGAAYVPLDPYADIGRIKKILLELDSDVCLVDARHQELWPIDKVNSLILDDVSLLSWLSKPVLQGLEWFEPVNPESPAYIIYTSGTTGEPKGVVCSHLGVVNLINSMNELAPIKERVSGTIFSRLSFDVSVYELWSVLLMGGELYLYSDQDRWDVKKYFEKIKVAKINSLYLPPSLLHEFLLFSGRNKLYLQRLLVGVEPIKTHLLLSIQRKIPGLIVVNGYGPTETTVCASLYKLPKTLDQLIVPIGFPVKNTKWLILDKDFQLVNFDGVGELYIAGPGVAIEYYKNSLETRRAFVLKGGLRYYKTGDLVRHSSNGGYEFIGRVDNSQIKLNGYRVEIQSVVNTLLSHDGVSQATVIKFRNNKNDYLIAFLVLSHESFNLKIFRAAIVRELPFYMQPRRYIILDCLPITENGKIDENQLVSYASKQVESVEVDLTYVEYDNDLYRLCEIWKEVFPCFVNMQHDFYMLGGNSLTAAVLAKKASEAFKVDIKLKDVFLHCSILDQIGFIRQCQKEHKSIKPISSHKSFAITFLQKYMLFSNLFDASSWRYNVPVLYRVNGDLSKKN